MKKNMGLKKLIIAALAPLLLLFLAITSAFGAGAKLFLSPATGSYYVGSYFSVEVLVNTGGNSTNAYGAVLAYPTDRLEPIAVSGGGSICDLWITQNRSTLECGATKPYKGTGGRIGTITFRAKAAGTAIVNIAEGNVKRADGTGAEILSARQSATFEIQDTPEGIPAISSSTHPDQSAWYQARTAVLSWTAPAGATGYSYILTSKAEEIPDDRAEGTDTSKTYEDLTDGVWYLHLKAQSGNTWSNTNHFRLQIDNRPPEDFEIVVDPPGERIAKAPLLSFAAVDRLSGLDHYEIAVDGSGFVTTTSPYQFERIRGGIHEITVRAVDRAGNLKEAKATLDIIGVAVPAIVYPVEGDRIPLLSPLNILVSSAAVGRIEMAMDGNVFTTLDSNTGFDYTYRRFLLPGEHTLTATFISTDGIESDPATARFRVDAGTVNLFGLKVPWFVFYPILLVILAGLILLARRWIRKFIRARRKPAAPVAPPTPPETEKETPSEAGETESPPSNKGD